MGTMTDDPKRQIIRCPAGCGNRMDFTFGLRKCSRCEERLCQNCLRRVHGEIFCKEHHREKLRELCQQKWGENS